MREPTENIKEILPEQPNQEFSVASLLVNAAEQMLAILFWVYALVKVFVFDIDIYLASKLTPEYVWLLDFKFLILIGIVGLFWLFTNNRYIFLMVIYVVFYPLIVLFWKIPFLIYKQKSWLLAFVFINSLITLIKSIKFGFITSAFFLISTAIVINASNKILLGIAALVVLAILFTTYIHRLISAFKPSGIFQVYNKLLSDIRKRGASMFTLDKDIKNLPIANLDQTQVAKRRSSLESSILFNRICLFTGKKLRAYQNSGLNVASNVISILMLIILTVLSFAVINFALFKIESQQFSFSEVPTFFIFFYYSFNNLLFSSIREIVPNMPISQMASMIESFCALLVATIFVFLLLDFRSQRHKDELEDVIQRIEEQGNRMESFIKDEFKINSIDDAMTEIEKLKGSMTKILYKISESIK